MKFTPARKCARACSLIGTSSACAGLAKAAKPRAMIVAKRRVLSGMLVLWDRGFLERAGRILRSGVYGQAGTMACPSAEGKPPSARPFPGFLGPRLFNHKLNYPQ